MAKAPCPTPTNSPCIILAPGFNSSVPWRLADDGEAFAFGERMLQEVMRTDADRYPGSGWVMDITEGEGDRAVGSIPFILGPPA